MALAARTVTHTVPQRMTISATLTLAQWVSPSYPLGSFAYSHGVEAAIAQGWVGDAAGLQAWLCDVLQSGSGRADATLLCAAYRAPDVHDLMQIDATGRAFASSHERLRESLHQGAAFARTTQAVWGDDISQDLLFVVALGWACARHDIPLQLAVSLYLHSFVSNIVMASVRLMPLGQTQGQAVLHALAPMCEAIAQEVQTATLDDLYANTFLSDIAAMRHETLQPRLFQS